MIHLSHIHHNVFLVAVLLFGVWFLIAPAIASGTCDTSWCRSPRTGGGTSAYDCWAGTDREACKCSEGSARLLGQKAYHRGQKYYKYTCCTGGTNVGEECGDYRHLSLVTLILSIIFSLFGFLCCIMCVVYCFYSSRTNSDRLEPCDEYERRVVILQGPRVGGLAGGPSREFSNFDGAPSYPVASLPPPPPPAYDSPQLPPGWTQIMDPNTGKPYYVSPEGGTTWTAPSAPGVAYGGPSTMAMAYGDAAVGQPIGQPKR